MTNSFKTPAVSKLVFILLFLIPAIGWSQPVLKTPVDSAELSHINGTFSFIIANDLGRNGYYDQKTIAEMMGQVSGLAGTEFVAALGDIHHFMGVQSVYDPLWNTNYEWVYSHPELMIPWYPVLGNHEYRGNTSAVLSYSAISRRWQMPSRYYSKTIAISDSSSVLVLFIDTTPLIDKYRSDPQGDAAKEDVEKQLRWIDSTLTHSSAKWKIVMGHHPVYAGTLKPDTEQADMQNRLKPILEKGKADFYICGHIHIFQHIKMPSSDIDYVVNSSGSLNRPAIAMEGIVFSSGEPGFLLCSVDDSQIRIFLISKEGKIIYRFSRQKATI
jgi:hypothetical protein